MNSTEHLVEQYFRFCHKCLTVSDIKVAGGVNRQIDLLAYQPSSQKYLHVEVSVTHNLGFLITFPQLAEKIDQKFFGVATKRKDNPKSDAARKKSFLQSMENVYQQYSAARESILHVFCVWCYDPSKVEAWQEGLALKYGNVPAENFRVLSFRDEVLPRLEYEIGTSFYDDELARLLSLQKARNVQLHLPGIQLDKTSPFWFSF